MSKLKMIKEWLQVAGQSHLIDRISGLGDGRIEAIYHQLYSWQKQLESPETLPSSPTLSSPSQVEREEECCSAQLGQLAIDNGEVETIILAGGDGSRLQADGPKALFEILQNRTLLSLFIERVPSHCTLSLLTSPRSYPLIQKALPPHYPKPMMQPTLPFADAVTGEWRLDENLMIASGPNGNGGVFQALAQSKQIEEWKIRGVQTVVIMPIDNALINPYDPTLIGTHIQNKNELTLRAFERSDGEKKVGVIGEADGRLQIIDYTDPHFEHKGANSLTLANANHMCLSIEFLESMIRFPLPHHHVHKNVQLDENSQPWEVIKTETFITDIAPLAQKSSVLISPKENFFAPLKTREDIPLIRNLLEQQGLA